MNKDFPSSLEKLSQLKQSIMIQTNNNYRLLYNFTTISEPEQPDSSQQPESSNHGATAAYMKAKAQETQQKPQIIFRKIFIL